MTYFNNDFVKFFRELEKNNTTDWFHANKTRFENSVKKPFHKFIDDLIDALRSVHPNLDMTAKEAIFRINRDIRFSKDKSPYKTHMSALISEYGKKEYSKPALYVQANHKDVRVYSGSHDLDKLQLEKLRRHIVKNITEFNKLINAKPFKSMFGEILGEKNKKLSPEFQKAAEKQPLLYNKSYYYFYRLPTAVLTGSKLIEEIVSGYKKAVPINKFLLKGIK